MIDKLESKVLLNIKGKNINNFIRKVTLKQINILSLKYIDKNEVEMLIYAKDYKAIEKIKSIYNVLEKEYYGIIKIKKIININKHLLFILSFCFVFFIVLTHIVFDVDVVHSNKEIRTLIKTELNKKGIKKYAFKKSYNNLEKIKEQILNKHKDKLEWIEIEEKGTKYLVKVEERELNTSKKDDKPRSLIAKKDGIIKTVISTKGDIVRNKEDYVKKGDTIINGEIILNEKPKGKVKADGKVYAEVWYVVKTDYPFVYHEEKETGKEKEIYTIEFLNKDIELTLNRFKHKKKQNKIIFKHNIIPFKLIRQRQKEIKIKNQILTFDEALLKAKEVSIKKINQKLNKEEYIIRNKYLKSTMKDSTIEIEMFFSVYEDITDYKEIE